MTRDALNYIKDQGSLQGVVIDHISPFRHIINYAGKYLEAYVWPGSNCDPKIGDKVVFKPFPNGGFNMIISGPNHDESDILVCGKSSAWGGGSTDKMGFQWRKGSDDWHKVYSGDTTLLLGGANAGGANDTGQVVKTLILKGSMDGTIPDNYFMISSHSLKGAETDQNFTLQRSSDGGIIWTTLNGIYNTINDISFDINKNLWSISGDMHAAYPGPYPYENNILFSPDNGDTWQVMWTESGANMNDASKRGLVRRIFTHPTDPLTDRKSVV